MFSTPQIKILIYPLALFPPYCPTGKSRPRARCKSGKSNCSIRTWWGWGRGVSELAGQATSAPDGAPPLPARAWFAVRGLSGDAMTELKPGPPTLAPPHGWSGPVSKPPHWTPSLSSVARRGRASAQRRPGALTTPAPRAHGRQQARRRKGPQLSLRGPAGPGPGFPLGLRGPSSQATTVWGREVWQSPGTAPAAASQPIGP